jgi:hypothetical protein
MMLGHYQQQALSIIGSTRHEQSPGRKESSQEGAEQNPAAKKGGEEAQEGGKKKPGAALSLGPLGELMPIACI